MQFTHSFIEITEDGQTKEHCFAKDPAVVHLLSRYFLYFSTYGDQLACGGQAHKKQLRIGIAQSEDGENWQYLMLLPLEGACEQNGVGAPGAFVQDGRVHLFYQTYGNREHDAICHAWSEDGVHFTRNASNPVFSPTGDWCCGRAIDADVVAFGDKLYLYFATRDESFTVQKLGVACADLHSAFARGDWQQCKKAPCLEPGLPWEQKCIEAPATIAHQGRIYLFYGGAYNCQPQQIGVAVSENGVDFTRLSDKPFLANGAPGSWNASESGHPYVFEDTDGKVYLYYQGSPDQGRTWILSRCRIGFQADRPVLLP